MARYRAIIEFLVIPPELKLELQKMPKTFQGLLSFAIMSVVSVVIGLWVVNRVPFLSQLIAGRRAA